jgi:UDP-N-acetylmuramate--alanine ligase
MNIYFSGIGGVGIGPLAEVALDAGHNVWGSDQNEGYLTDVLEARGVAISFIQDGTFLEVCHETAPIDRFIHTAALPPDHPELKKAKALGIPISKRDELTAQIIAEKNLQLIAIAGTHGKTTTTGMFIWAMKQLGIPVSYSVGTTLSFGPSGTYSPDSQYFLYECDEFDRNFLHFSPALSLITSIDYDHPDTYPTEESYIAAFRRFIGQSRHTILWKRDNRILPPGHSASWVLQPNEVAPLDMLAGLHNRQNASLVLKAIEYLNLASPDAALRALTSFPGTSRRFEKLADNLYSDYAHHPTEIAATLQMARELSNHVVAIYQPHQNTRQHELQHLYIDCFALAEEVYWLPTYLTREDPSLPIIPPSELTARIAQPKTIHLAQADSSLRRAVAKARQAGKLVVIMGAGDIDVWARSNLL